MIVLDDDWLAQTGMYTLSCRKMVNAGFGGSSLASDLEELRVNDSIIEDYKKTVKVLESKTVTDNRNVLIQSYKINILQLETRNKYLRDKIDRC